MLRINVWLHYSDGWYWMSRGISVPQMRIPVWDWWLYCVVRAINNYAQERMRKLDNENWPDEA